MSVSVAAKPGLDGGSPAGPAQLCGSHSLGKAPSSRDACLGLRSVPLTWSPACHHRKADA